MDFIRCTVKLESADKHYTDKFGCLVALDNSGKDEFFEELRELRVKHIHQHHWRNTNIKMDVHFELAGYAQVQIGLLNQKFGNNLNFDQVLSCGVEFQQFLNKVAKSIEHLETRIHDHQRSETLGN